MHEVILKHVAHDACAVVIVAAMTDTNCNPDLIDYPIPSNDDAIRAVRLVTTRIADAVIEGGQRRDFGGDADEFEFDGQTTYTASPEDMAPGEAEAATEEPEPVAAAVNTAEAPAASEPAEASASAPAAPAAQE